MSRPMTTFDENAPLLPSIEEEPLVSTGGSPLPKIRTRAAIKEESRGTGSTGESVVEDKDNISSKYGSRKKQALLFGIMLLVNVLGPLSTEAQVPALQDIANDLNTTSQWVQLTITIYMLSFGASQLFFGTLSDMYGRRNTLLVGLTIYTLTNVGCALAPNVALLNIFRAIQAMGSGAGMVIVYAIARDIFEQNDRTRVLGILGGLRPIVIAASPIFGGAVAAFWGWRFIFWIIGALSLMLLIITFFLLPETRDSQTVHITTVREYKDTVKILVKNRVFVGLVLISGAVYAGVFIMFNEFSFVMESRFGFSEFDTGLLCGLIVFGLMVGSLVSICLVRCFNPISVVCIGIVEIFLCGGLLVLPLILYGKTAPDYDGLTEYWTLVPLFLYVCADGLMLPHLISTALEPFKQQAGTASALAGFWRFFSAAVIALIVSSSSSKHLLVLHIGTATMAILSAVLYGFTLYGVDATEFTASRDEELARQHEAKLRASGVNIDTGVQVIGDDEYEATVMHLTTGDTGDSGDSGEGNIVTNNGVNDKTPLISREGEKHVTIQA